MCFLNVPTKSWFYYINIPHNLFIQLDMTLNYMCLSRTSRKFLYRSMINPLWVGALHAPTQGGLLKLLERHVPGSPRWTMKLRVISIWINRLWDQFMYLSNQPTRATPHLQRWMVFRRRGGNWLICDEWYSGGGEVTDLSAINGIQEEGR